MRNAAGAELLPIFCQMVMLLIDWCCWKRHLAELSWPGVRLSRHGLPHFLSVEQETLGIKGSLNIQKESWKANALLLPNKNGQITNATCVLSETSGLHISDACPHVKCTPFTSHSSIFCSKTGLFHPPPPSLLISFHFDNIPILGEHLGTWWARSILGGGKISTKSGGPAKTYLLSAHKLKPFVCFGVQLLRKNAAKPINCKLLSKVFSEQALLGLPTANSFRIRVSSHWAHINVHHSWCTSVLYQYTRSFPVRVVCGTWICFVNQSTTTDKLKLNWQDLVWQSHVGLLPVFVATGLENNSAFYKLL